MSIYRKNIDFPPDYENKLREAANRDPEKFKSAKGHRGSVNALIIAAIDFYLPTLLTQESEQSPTPNKESHQQAA